MNIFRKSPNPPPLTEREALYGAVFNEIISRYNLECCITPEERAKLAVMLRDILQWAQTQPTDIKLAYQKACATISSDADKHLENANRVRYMMELRRTLPKPPQ